MTDGGSRYIVHDRPVWRGDQNYIATADLAPFGFEGDFEQLWLRSSGDGLVVACIPFRVYGLALGDTVELGADDCLKLVSARSGRRVLRVLFAESALEAAARLRDFIAEKLLSEWSGERHVAIDFPGGRLHIADEIGKVILQELDGGLAFWEWGDSRPFMAS